MFEDVGLLILRVVTGGVVLAHGLQKVGQLGGFGFEGTAGFLGGLGFWPAKPWTAAVIVAEIMGPLLMILGLLGPIGPGLVAMDLIIAVLVFHRPKGFWDAHGGYEYVAVIAAAAVANTLIGHGAISLDALFKVTYPDWLLPAWVVIMALGGIAALVSRIVGPKPENA